MKAAMSDHVLEIWQSGFQRSLLKLKVSQAPYLVPLHGLNAASSLRQECLSNLSFHTPVLRWCVE